MAEPQRIAKLLARAGVASRREIERMIADRRIAIDGVAIETPATIVRSLSGVTVDGQPVAEPDHARLFLYHKPTGVLTTANDPAGRKTIYDRMPEGLPRVVPIGRLDLNTEGLLLLTTDGGLKRQLELPATGVERTYRVRAYGQITQAQLEGLSEGIEIEGVRYGSIDANIERRTGANVWIEMRLREGKNREIRRVLEFLGLEVNRLIRVSYGPFVLADLPVADAVEVLQHDLVAFLKDLKIDAVRAAKTGSPRGLPERPAETPTQTPRRSTPLPLAGGDGGGQSRAHRSGSRPQARQEPTPNPSRKREGSRPRPAEAITLRQEEPKPRRRSTANPHKAAERERPQTPEAPPTDAPRAPRPAKGKGWAKASKPAKRVGVGRPKRATPRPDRAAPETEARPAGAAPRPPRGRSPSADGPAPAPRPGRPPSRDGAPRPPRPGRRR